MKAGLGQSRLLIASLCLLLALLIGVAWQASRSITAHRATAIAVLEDYARLAADEFSRRAIVATGYYGYYAVMTRLNSEVAADGNAIVAMASGDITEAVPPAANLFAFDTADRVIVASSSPLTPAFEQYVSDTLAQFASTDLPDSGFEISHGELDGIWHTFVVAWTEDGSMLYGFKVDRAWQRDTLQQVLEDGPLLPASLADGAMTNELLYVSMHDGGGAEMFAAVPQPVNSMPRPTTAVELVLTDEYEGLFRDHVVRVAIVTDLADDLIVGGLPATRLPIIALMIVLAAILLVTAFRQLRRETAIAEMRTNFVAEVSHELRTPLTQIRMFTESLILDRLRTSEDRSRALSIIQRESKRLIHLVENILRFSGNGHADIPFRPQRQPLAPVVSSMVDEFESLAAARRASIEARLDADVVASVDTDAVRQILINLLDNALKYGPDGQTIVVSLGTNDGKAFIAVDDEGPGVPEAERARIWTGFIRLDRDRDRATAGAGIGLAVVADLASRHGGAARVEDGARGGARFVVEIPA